MSRPDPITTARELVIERFPTALQAWLGGSAAARQTTLTSDLDITVLIAKGVAHRESLTFKGWPIEIFVNTEFSIRYWVEKDEKERKPTTCRLVGQAIPLLDGHEGREIQQFCKRILDDGPQLFSEAELNEKRYTISDLLDDLVGGGPAIDMAAVILEVWQHTATLLLMARNRWLGTGKWLARELRALDVQDGTRIADEFQEVLVLALNGQLDQLFALARKVLEPLGGRLRDGYYLNAPVEAQG